MTPSIAQSARSRFNNWTLRSDTGFVLSCSWCALVFFLLGGSFSGCLPLPWCLRKKKPSEFLKSWCGHKMSFTVNTVAIFCSWGSDNVHTCQIRLAVLSRAVWLQGAYLKVLLRLPQDVSINSACMILKDFVKKPESCPFVGHLNLTLAPLPNKHKSSYLQESPGMLHQLFHGELCWCQSCSLPLMEASPLQKFWRYEEPRVSK